MGGRVGTTAYVVMVLDLGDDIDATVGARATLLEMVESFGR
jgi:hypothetical protein